MLAHLQGPRPARGNESGTGSCYRKLCLYTWHLCSHLIGTEGLLLQLLQVNSSLYLMQYRKVPTYLQCANREKEQTPCIFEKRVTLCFIAKSSRYRCKETGQRNDSFRSFKIVKLLKKLKMFIIILFSKSNLSCSIHRSRERRLQLSCIVTLCIR